MCFNFRRPRTLKSTSALRGSLPGPVQPGASGPSALALSGDALRDIRTNKTQHASVLRSGKNSKITSSRLMLNEFLLVDSSETERNESGQNLRHKRVRGCKNVVKWSDKGNTAFRN